MGKLLSIILKNAFRNLLRNKRRTLLTGMAIIISTVAMLLIMDYNKTSMYFFREGQIQSRWGHIQVKKKGYYGSETTSLKYMLSKEEVAKVKKVIKESNFKKNMKHFLVRINFSGLLLKEGDSEASIVVGSAIDPQKETLANPGLKYGNIYDGNFLSGQEPGELVIGTGLAKRLNLKVSDVVYLYSVGGTGLPDIMEGKISGIISFGTKSVDDIIIYADVEDIQKLFGTENIHDIVIFLDDTNNVNDVLKYMKSKLDPNTYEIFAWSDLATDYKQVVSYIFQNFFFTIFIIVVVLIFLSTNTILMSVMERMSEFGTLRAIGRNRIEISLMIIFEAIILGIVCSITGLGIGAFLAKFLTSLSIPLPPPPGGSISYPLSIFTNPESLLLIFLIQMATILIATIYPVLKISRVKIIDAIRYY
ncbi:MAG: hypothetical protein A2086_16155 [Spirochaetes bacterium GWD1_27_9]|nr:MAG: hypothetical protein A2Z98_07065 [Spirochaetes bacterium GWB1_27_13]OHD21503.1 MAG: hypothetical protein A2Y34_01495 [Spirochaetes bacterium GWC1_27_15]OHD44185.1 MAG: hypothetical protein A2086_16155 [Spirochaetes bacterium GWD1_27_9]